MNPIRLLSTTYTDIITDLNNDVRTATAPPFFKIMFAGIFAILTIRINVLFNQVLLGTAQDRTIAEDILAWQDYQMQGLQPALVQEDIEIDAALTTSGPYTVALADLKAAVRGDVNTPQIPFEARAAFTFPQGQSTTTLSMWQQQTISAPVTIGVTDGTNLQTFDLPDPGVIPETLTLTIGSDVFVAARVEFNTTQDSFAYADEDSLIFVFKSRTDGTCRVTLGFIDNVDGIQYGKIPEVGLNVVANYAVTLGAAGNVAADSITEYTGSDAGVIAVGNTNAAQNGANQESLENAKMVAPLNSQTHNMFWDTASGKAIAQSVPGVLRAVVSMNGIMNVIVSVMPFGGGTASSQLLLAVKAALLAKSFFQQVEILSLSVNYVYLGISYQVKLKAGAQWVDSNGNPSPLQRYCALAAAYRSKETSFDVYQQYRALGINGIFDLINSEYSTLTGFTYTLDRDAAGVQRILDNVSYQDFGEGFGPSDIYTAIEGFVAGVDYVDVISPSSRFTIQAGSILSPVSIAQSLIP